jgi:ATP-dependent DNA helicase RecQ
VREREAGLMRSFAGGAGCLMRFLQEALDDPDASDCGRCSVCAGRLPAKAAGRTSRATAATNTWVTTG